MFKKIIFAITIVLCLGFIGCNELNGPIVLINDFSWERTNLSTENWWSGAIAVASNGDVWAASSHIYLSTDNGDTWINKGYTPYPGTATQIAINPVNGSVFVISSEDFGGALYRSTNNGNSWEWKFGGFFNDIFITPSGGIYLATYRGVYYSSDNGDTWIEKNNGLPDDNREPTTSIFCIVEGTDCTLYAGVYGSGVYHSTNAGDEWLPSSSHTDVHAGRLIISDDGSIFATVLYKEGVLKSSDKGLTWHQIINGLDIDYGIPFYNIIYNPITKHVFVGHINNGIYRSTNSGAEWHAKNDGLSSSMKIPISTTFAVNPRTGMMFTLIRSGSEHSHSLYRSVNK